MPSKCVLTGGAFQDSEGHVLANGYLHMELSQDSSVAGIGNIAAGITITITLDANGNVNSSPAQAVWGNDVLLPVNNFYKVTGYTAAGQPAWGPNNQQVIGSTFNVGTWIPNQVISWVPPLQALELEVNGTPNADQNLLNLTAGANITIMDAGAGEVTIAASGGGGGVAGKWAGNWLSSNAGGYTGAGGSTTTAGNSGMDIQQISSQPQAYVGPTATEPVAIQVQSSSLLTAGAFLDQAQNLTVGVLQDWFMKAQIVGVCRRDTLIGMTDTSNNSIATTFNSDTPNTHFVGFRWSSGTDTNIKAVCSTSSSNITVVDTGISTVTTAHVFEIVPTNGGSSITFYIDGVLVATISTNVPSNSLPMSTVMTVDGKNSGTTTFNINFFYVYALVAS